MSMTLNRCLLATLWVVAATKSDAFFNPHIGRFANRDPISEAGGIDLYAFPSVDPVNYVDYLGLCKLVGGPGIRYRVAFADLDRFHAPATPYKDLAGTIVTTLRNNWGTIAGVGISFPNLTSAGPFSGKNTTPAPAGNVTAGHYLLFVDWEVDDPENFCHVKYDEDITSVLNPRGTHTRSDRDQDAEAVTRAVRTIPLRGCTHTIIYGDAPGNLAVKAPMAAPLTSARGFIQTVTQTTKLVDRRNPNAPISTVTWTVRIEMDSEGNLSSASP